MTKVLNIDSLKSLKYKNKNKKIILCHGVFDLLHVGHINYFKSAKKLGDILVVSVTEDKFVNKGPGRPAFNITNRINFLNEINCIDYLYISNEETSEKVISALKPDFYCKGSDYSKSDIKFDAKLKKELNALRFNKGKFKIISEPSFSSSSFINKYGMQNFSQDTKNFINIIKQNHNYDEISKFIDKVYKKKVLIIGEMIIDKYINTEAIGKSGKEPMMVIKPVNEIKFVGGVGYIANLCSSFVNSLNVVSYLGEKKTEIKFIKKNLSRNIKFDFFLKKDSPTISKLRFLDNYKKTKLLGVYDLNDELINKKEEKKLISILKNKIIKSDIVIVADYGHGLISKKIRKLLLMYSKKLFLNTQINSFNRGYHTVFKYKKMNTLIINESELRYEIRDKKSSINDLAKKLSEKISAKNIIITRGVNGATIFDTKSKLSIDSPAFSLKNVDTIGAGDTFFTFCSLFLSLNIDKRISLLISSIAASFSIDQLSNKVVFNLSILKKYLLHMLR